MLNAFAIVQTALLFTFYRYKYPTSGYYGKQSTHNGFQQGIGETL